MKNESPCLLLWNYTEAEQAAVERFLAEVKAPPAIAIRPDQGYCTVNEIVNAPEKCGEPFDCAEKVVLFYQIPNKGMSFLIDQARKRGLPQPIYAAVTEYSIEWPFNELAHELIQEREAFRLAAQQAQTGE